MKNTKKRVIFAAETKKRFPERCLSMKRFAYLLILLLVGLIDICAVPARRTPRAVVQPDGSIITLTLNGDEFGHWYTTDDGQVVVRNAEGMFVPCSPYEWAQMRQRAAARRMAAGRTAGRRASAPMRIGQPKELKGTRRVLVVLAESSDIHFKEDNPKAAFDQHLNGERYKGSGYGSARDYFKDQSNGLFTPQFDIYGPYQAAKEMSYYGENDDDGSDKHAAELVNEVLKKGNKDINFKDYDSDGDGVVDFCYVIYAGYNEAKGGAESTIWPHKWELQEALGETLYLDGVQVNDYACSSELDGGSGSVIDGIGTICHEFCHCLGLPDFYDISEDKEPSEENCGMGVWSLMDYGCYNENGFTPCAFTAFEKEFFGWLDIETLHEEQEVTLRPTADGGKAYRIVSPTNPGECYIVENIHQEGWNRAALAHGMQVTHVDYVKERWMGNHVNDTLPEGMSVVPADGQRARSYTGWKGDLYPGPEGNAELTDYSTPAAQTNDGGFMCQSITDIRETDGTVTFSFMKGSRDATTATTATDVTATSFTAHWKPCEGTEEYILELFHITGQATDDRRLWNASLLNGQGELMHTEHTTRTALAVGNLEGESLYCYRVSCMKGGNLSACSNLIFVLTTPYDSVLPTPHMERPEATDDNGVHLQWNAVEGASYIVEYRRRPDSDTKAQPDGRTLVEETFNALDVKDGDISRVLDKYTSKPDWSGTEVRAQNGCVVIGDKEKNGQLMTPLLPCREDYVTITFSAHRYDKKDGKPFLHICLITDQSQTQYTDQRGSYIESDEDQYFYCVLGPLDTGSAIVFVSNCEPGNDVPRVCLDNVTVCWGDQSYLYQSAGMRRFGEKRATGSQPAHIAPSASRYVETTDTACTLTDLESGLYDCRVRAVKDGECSPYSDARLAVVGNAMFEAEGLNLGITSVRRHTVRVMPFDDDRLYKGDIVIPEKVTYEGTEYTVTGLSNSTFRGCSELTSVSVPPTVKHVGSNLFKGCKQLGYVDWNTAATIDSTAFIGTGMNTLLFVSGDTPVESDDVYTVRDGHIDALTLYIGSPFLCPRDFHAGHVQYLKDFSQPTVVGSTSGWETLILPFDVQQVVSEKVGIVTPFGTDGSEHHYWLGQFNGTAFERVSEMRANVPYIIAFPNSKTYMEKTRVNGTIAFMADDATIRATLDVPAVSGTQFDFVPVYKKVYKSIDRYMLNVYDESSTALEGSTFRPNEMSLRTFGAYMLSHGHTRAPQCLPIEFNVHQPEADETADGLFTLDGRRVGTEAGHTPELSRGFYITQGKKIFIP